MMAVLSEALGQFDAEIAAALAGPGFHGGRLIDNVVLPGDPDVLTLVRCQHCPLFREHGADVDGEIDRRGPAIAVAAANRIHEIEMGNCIQCRGRPGPVVGNRRCETGVPNQHADDFMVGMIVDGRRRQDDRRSRSAQGLGDDPSRRVIVEHSQIAQPQTPVIGADHGGRPAGLALADVGDHLGRLIRRAAFAGGRGDDGHVVSKAAQQRERPAGKNLDIIRMGMDGEDRAHCGRLAPPKARRQEKHAPAE